MTVASLIAYCLCGMFLFCTWMNLKKYLLTKDDRYVVYAVITLFSAFIVAVIGGV